jgi:D-glycero-alpha-D-manno-heptose-7-phosphate kinase
MIITQTPLRIGLLGGGTDLPGFYREHGGRVLNCAIDKYVYVIVKQRFDDAIYVNYSKKEIVSRVADLEHELVREAMQMTGVTKGVEITTLADIPSTGSGLGSSSAVTVGLLHALFVYQGQQVSAEELAQRACTIEIERCGKPIGKQDQYIAAFGGIRDIHFGPGEDVLAEELVLPAAQRRTLQHQIMLFYTGITRSATPILAEQNANITTTQPHLHLLRDLAGFAVDRLRGGDVEAVGAALRESWEVKRKLASGVTNDRIDDAVSRALGAGAYGAKLTGAGGGGFLLVICPMERQRIVRESLADMQELPVKLDRQGSRVVLNVLRDIWGLPGLKVNPQVPAERGRAGQPVHGQRGGVHETLVAAGDPEEREVPLHAPSVVHQRVGVVRAVGVVVDELFQPQVTQQAGAAGVAEVSGQHPRRGVGLQQPQPRQREGPQQHGAADDADRHEIVQ